MPVFLGPFFAAITGSLGWIARVVLPTLLGSFVAHVLVRIGLYLVYLGAVMFAVNQLIAMASSTLTGLPADLLQIMTMSGMITAMNIIASAYVFKLTMRIDYVKLLTSKVS